MSHRSWLIENWIVRSVFFALCAISMPLTASADDVTCECEESTCGACMVETGTTFYSAKCGPGGSRVKSCKKPTCEAVENQKQCLALINSESKKPVLTPAESKREPANVQTAKGGGKIHDVHGSAYVNRANGSRDQARKELPVREGDVVEAKDNGKVLIVLDDDSEVVVAPNTSLKFVKLAVDKTNNARNIAMTLLRGKVRSKVSEGYKTENTFDVKTTTAVAGVRGTEFVTSFVQGDKEWITEVKTFKGKVRLAGLKAEEAGEHRMVVDGTSAAFIIDAPAKGVPESEFDKIVADGTLTPVSYMSEDEMRLLRDAMDFYPAEAKKDEATRAVASMESDAVCQAPMGKYNQCSFSCEGAAPGDKSCDLSKQGVSCVRRLCRANGQWTEPKRMPASQGDLCDPTRAVVRDCGSYW